MARWPRLAAVGIPMHITRRGNNRTPTFLCASDFARYRALLQLTSASTGCAIHAYALMTNHVHLLLTPASANGASRLMQRLGRLYVPYFNARHGRSETLWEGRFKSSIIDSATYFLACSRYIDLNPVKAAVVDAPHQYAWSSFAHLGRGEPDALISLHPEYLALGRSDVDRRSAYRAFCAGPKATDADSQIRHATQGGEALGSRRFTLHAEATLRRRVIRFPRGGDRLAQATDFAQRSAHF